MKQNEVQSCEGELEIMLNEHSILLEIVLGFVKFFTSIDNLCEWLLKKI